MPEPTATGARGHSAPSFEPLRAAFETVLADSPNGGAALTVLVDGAPLVELHGGLADPRSGAPWTAATTSVFFSMTKGLVALLVARLVDAGRIDLDAPVSAYWPEFGQAGKAAITVRQVMSHRAGLSFPAEDVSRDDILAWDPIIRKLERQEPSWEPGTAHQYHAMTYGWLVGELIQRVTGSSIGEVFQRDLALPAGGGSWIGLPADQLDRVAQLVPEPGYVLALPDEIPGAREIVRALTLGGGLPPDIAGDGTGLNDPLLHQAAVPAGLGIGTASALARMWSSAIVATPSSAPLTAAVLDDMTVPRSTGTPLWPLPGAGDESWGTGFQIPSVPVPMLGPTSFGHAGAGGQLSFADREHRLAFAFLTSDLRVFDDTRAARLVAALGECLPSAAPPSPLR